MTNPNHIVITGLPRSGTTLVCHLINKVDNAVALNEPIKIKNFKALNEQQILENIASFFNHTGEQILQQKQAVSLLVDDAVPDNHMASSRESNGLRQLSEGAQKGLFDITKSLNNHFKLCIKHNAIFSQLLDQLNVLYPCYAIIRNPLSLLASWSTVKLPINRGHIPAAEKINPELSAQLNQTHDVVDRQITIMSWFFERFSSLSNANIIRYEDVVSSGGNILKKMIPGAETLNEKLRNKNLNDLYDHNLMLKLGEKLLVSEGSMWNFYNKEDIEKLMSEISQR